MLLADDPKGNLQLLEAMVQALPKLLGSGDLTRSLFVEVEGETLRPAMSLGLVLDLLHRLEGAFEAPDARRRLEVVRQASRAALDADREATADHLLREIRSHVDTWRAFVRSCVEAEEACGDDFRMAVERRARAALLIAEARHLGIDPAAGELSTLDADFQAATRPGDYAGPDPEAAYPAARFPWLYRQPPAGV